MHGSPIVSEQRVYRVLRQTEWREMNAAGRFEGSTIDRRDGFIHLSAQEQVAGTLSVHFAGESDLVVLEIDAARLGDALKWEPSRDGALFPHLYGMLPVEAVIATSAASAFLPR